MSFAHCQGTTAQKVGNLSHSKKLQAGDCSWGTMKLILGWIIDTVTMTITLPPHRIERLAAILEAFPALQRQTSIKRWHKTLGELQSMSLALPGLHNIFSSMHTALSTESKGRIALGKGIQDTLDDFWWMHQNISTCPTRIPEVIPLPPVAEGHHDASEIGAGGIWFPRPHLDSRGKYVLSRLVVW
jgi:hypothetical protein